MGIAQRVLLIAFAAVAALLVVASPAWAADSGSQSMYRLYNPNSGEHFYTARTSERDKTVAAGWRYEGVGWTAPARSNIPVYRLYSGMDHHYTMNASERDSLIRAGWHYEGIGWYSAESRAVPLYRQFNPNVNPRAPRDNSGSHNYTTSKKENDDLVRAGWRAEGVGWYGLRSSGAGSGTSGGGSSSGTGTQKKAKGVPLSQCWATLYDDGELVLQDNNATDAGRGVRSHFLVGRNNFESNRNIKKITSRCDIAVDARRNGSPLRMFGGCSNLTDISGLSRWDVCEVSNFFDFFGGCHSLKDLSPIAAWDVSNGTNFAALFVGCSSLEDLRPLANWNTSNAKRMDGIFQSCHCLKSLSGIEKWNTRNLNDIGLLFEGCDSLENISALSSWDVSGVTSMNQAFQNCESLSDLRALRSWNVGNCSAFSNMFRGCRSLTDVTPISSWNVSKGENFGGMFGNCGKLTDARPLEAWGGRLSPGAYTNGMFSNTPALQNNRVPNWYQY